MVKVFKQLLLLSVAKYVVYGLTFIKGLLIARIFSQQEYADWGIVMFVSAYYSILGLGIPNLILLAVEKHSYRSEYVKKRLSIAVLFIVIIAVVSCIFVFVFPGIFKELLKPISVIGLLIMSFGLVLVEILKNLARIAENYIQIVIADVVSVLPVLLLLAFFTNMATPKNALIMTVLGIYS